MPGSNSVAECRALCGFRAQAWSGESDNVRFPNSTGQQGPPSMCDDTSLNTDEMALQSQEYPCLLLFLHRAKTRSRLHLKPRPSGRAVGV